METLTAAQTDVIPAVAALPASGRRIISLDQFRGYTVAGMFVVNFLGGFAVTPAVLRHHNSYCSYADTIMPQFLFAVGFAFRLTFASPAGWADSCCCRLSSTPWHQDRRAGNG
jgi:predicted acyltransferase